MFREKLKDLAPRGRRMLACVLPLTVGEWLCVGAAIALLLALVFPWLVLRMAPDQAFESYWRLKVAGLNWVGRLNPEFSLPDGRSLSASRLAADSGTAEKAAKALPHLLRAERTATWLFPFLVLLAGWAWSTAKGHMAPPNGHIRGGRVIAEKELASGLKGERGLLPLGPVFLPREYEGRHLLIAGDREARSVVLTQQLEAIRQAGLPALVLDLTGEFVEKFYRSGVDHIVNPFDERGVGWNLFDDVASITELSAFAGSLIPFNKAARDLLRGIVAALFVQGKRTHADLWAALNSSMGTLARLCAATEQGTAGNRILEAPYGRGVAEALALLRSQFSWLEFARGKGGFSVKKWLADPGGSFVFLTSHPEVEHTLRPYLSLQVESFGRGLLTLKKRPKGRLFFVLDELAGLQLLPGIKRLLIHGGKQGAALILGVRDLASLQCHYHGEDVLAILNCCGSLLVLRLSDGRTADYFSWRFSDTQYWDARDLRSSGGKEAEGEALWSLAPRTDRLLIGSQFLELQDLAGYLSISPRHPALVKIPLTEANRLPAAAPPFVLRAEYSLDELAAGEAQGLEREVRLGIPGAPLRSGAATGGRAAAVERFLDERLEF